MDRPIISVTVAFSLGIVFGKCIPLSLGLVCFFLIVFFLLSVIAFIKKLNLSVFILVLFFLAGAFSFQIKNLPELKDITKWSGKGYLTVIGIVNDSPKIKAKCVSFPLKVEIVVQEKISYEAKGSVYVLIKRDECNLSYGDKIEVRGRLSEFQRFYNPLIFEGSKACCLYATFYKKISEGGNLFKKAAIWFREKFNKVLVRILPRKEASLLGSLLLGSSVSPLPEDLKDDYRKAGLIHLLVVSGTQVSILIGVCLAITRAFKFPLWLSILVTSFFNFILVIVTGGGPSILRAAIMGEITLIGLLFEREKEFYTALAISALILLLADPLNLFDIGFQLSFAATWALVYIAPVLKDCMINHGFTKPISDLLSISFAPILATSPIIAFNFSQVSLGAIFSNLLVLPWVEFLVILGFLTAVLGFIFMPLAQVLGGTLWLMLIVLDWIAKFVSSFPGAYFYIKAPSLVSILGYYLGLVIFVELLRRDKKLNLTIKRLAFGSILLISIFLWNAIASANVFGSRELTVTFLDVGQGDCILIEIPGGKKVLIDGGGAEQRVAEGIVGVGDRRYKNVVGEKVVVPFLRRKGINHLDLVIATHPHEDHIGGLIKALEEIKVDRVLDSGQVFESQAYERFKALIKANRIKYSFGRAGQVIRFAENITGYILNPFDPLLGDTNSDSIVMRLVYGDVSFLFTGDLGKEGEQRILCSSIFNLNSTVLKVGHHGSVTSTSDEFLRMVAPDFVVISVGKHNRYYHPHKSTLQKLREAGIKVYRTDEDGAVEVRTDGKKICIKVANRKGGG